MQWRPCRAIKSYGQIKVGSKFSSRHGSSLKWSFTFCHEWLFHEIHLLARLVYTRGAHTSNGLCKPWARKPWARKPWARKPWARKPWARKPWKGARYYD